MAEAKRTLRRRANRGRLIIGAGFALSVAGVISLILTRSVRSNFQPRRSKGGTQEGSVAGQPGVKVFSNNVRSGVRARPAVQRHQSSLISGRVASRALRPIAGATVCPVSEGAAHDLSLACVSSDANGRFSLELANETSVLVASAESYLGREVALAGSDFGKREVVIMLDEGGATVSGSVRDALGGPIIGALVAARNDQRPVAFALSDTAGAFRMTLPVGWVDVTAEADAYAPASMRVYPPADGLALVLGAASTIEGMVVNGEGGAPLANVTVMARRTEGTQRPLNVVSDVDGAFRLSPVLPGLYELEAVGRRLRSAKRDAVVGEGQAVSRIVLVATPAGALDGTVTVDGAPCPDGYATLSGPIELAVDLDPMGHFREESLPFGAYQLSIACSALQDDISESVEVGLEEVTRSWAMERGLNVTGKVVSPRGRPLPGVVVALEPEVRVGPSGVTCITDEGGEFSCPGLKRGQYSCRALQRDVVVSEPVWVDIGDSPPAPLVLSTRGSGTIRALVELPECAEDCRPPTPVAHAASGTHVYPAPGNGEFLFSELPLGRYTVDVGPLTALSPSVDLAADGQVVEIHVAASRAMLSGRVVDAAGVPVPDTWVSVVSTEPDWLMLTNPVGAALTDSDGLFALNGLVPGRYGLEAINDAARGGTSAVELGGPPVVMQLHGLAR